MEENWENWIVYVNGDLVPAIEAKISAFDRGFQFGDSVFEGLRCYDGRIFKLIEHTDRLFRSATAIGIEIPMTKGEFNEAVKSVVRANKFRNCHIKPQVSRGNAIKLGFDPRNTTKANIVIPARPIGKTHLAGGEGVKLACVSIRKTPALCLDPRVKSGNYLNNLLARGEAVSRGADEAIVFDIFGYVSEGAGCNIFFVKGGELYVPPVQDALGGITRQTVIEMAGRRKIKVNETRLTNYDIYNADEIFVTGSGAGIMPVLEVDKRTVSGGKIGPITKTISDDYYEEVKKGEPIFE
jgi:branched-chain amino acid aminotransferase